MEIVLLIIAGLAAGFFLGVFSARAKLAGKISETKAQFESQIAALTERLSQKEASLLECGSSLRAHEVENANLNEALTATKVELAQAATRAERAANTDLENAK